MTVEASSMLRTRTLGRTGLEISELGFGCGAGAGLMIGDDAAEQRAAIARALELGVTYFDTAPVYGERRSETNLGRTLAALGARPVVATKVTLLPEDLDDIPAAVGASVEGSLACLERDSVDVVYLHNRIADTRGLGPGSGTGARLSVEDVLGSRGVVAGLERLRRRGKVRFFGCCAYGGETEALEEVVASDRFDALLVHYNLINQTAFLPAIPGSAIADYGRVAATAAARGMGIVVLRVLEAGLLADDSRERGTRLDALRFLRDGEGRLAPAAIRFALGNAAVSTVLIGLSGRRQVDEAVAAAAQGPLSIAELARLEVVRTRDYR